MVSVGQCAFGTVNITVTQGADNSFAFRYLTGPEGGLQPVDLTGYEARAQIRQRVGGPVWLDMTDQDFIGLTADGEITIDIPAAITEDPAWNNYSRGFPGPSGVWDLELVDPTGGVVRFVEGTVTVCPDVTRND